MNFAPLAIVPAHVGSSRLPRKLLLDLGGKPLIRWSYEAAVEAVGRQNVVIATYDEGEDTEELLRVCHSFEARTFLWDGDGKDQLGRFYHCANAYRWHPDTMIVRVTPDDPFKDPAAISSMLLGYRGPVEVAAEAFTLGALNTAQRSEPLRDRLGAANPRREHLTWIFSETPPPPAPSEGVWSIDTPEHLEEARRQLSPPLILAP